MLQRTGSMIMESRFDDAAETAEAVPLSSGCKSTFNGNQHSIVEKPQSIHELEEGRFQESSSQEMLVFRVLIVFLCTIFLIATLPFSLLFCVKIVKEYERAVILRLGRIISKGWKGPGAVFVLPCTDHFIKVDLRLRSFEIPPQEILTRDSVTVSVDAVVYFRIHNPMYSITRVTNATSSTRLLAQTTIRNIVGGKTLTESLMNRANLSKEAQIILDEITDAWGVTVERVEMKDVRLPQQLQRVMAAEAEATQDAKAKVIAATGELNAAANLAKASDIIDHSYTALQLRYLQTLSTISAEKNSTILFPLAVDFCR